MNKEKVLNMVDPPNELKEQLINASMLAGLSFFTTLVGISIAVVRADPINTLLASCISAGFTFFTSLCVQRGLVKGEVSTVKKK